MKAGNLKPLLRVYRPAHTTDPGTGADRTLWERGRVILAERVRHTSTARVENRELFTDYRAEYRLRIQHRLTDTMRVEDTATGTLYAIVGVFPDPANGMLRISCERVND